MIRCTHLDQVALETLPAEVAGCEDCLREGTPWLHLRICLACGHVGCCDSSPRRHARAHAATGGHQVARSLEPGEEWSWCFADDVAMVLSLPAGSTRIPPSPLMAG